MYNWGCTFILLHKYGKTKENESFLLHLNYHSNNVTLCMKVHEGIGRQCRCCIVFGKNGKGFVPLSEDPRQNAVLRCGYAVRIAG